MTNWKRKKGISKSRVVIIVLILILGSTSLFNIMFMLHTASKLTDREEEPIKHGSRIHEHSPISVPTALYWRKGESFNSITGKLLKY